MKVKIESTPKGYWIANVIVKSGNKYMYSCLFYDEPSERQVIGLWQESNRKNWRRVN